MVRRLPPLNAIRAFEAAARHGSFKRAGAELNVSHAAVSRHVRGLEARLGVLLFRTTARGVELTEKGRAYRAALTPALDAIEQATEALFPAPSGSVAVSCEPTFASRWLLPRLAEFRRRCPEVAVDLDAAPLLVDLGTGEFDYAIRWGRGGWPGTVEELICDAPVYPVAAPSLAGQGSLTPAEIARLPLLHEDGGALWRRWFTAAGYAEGGPARAAGRLSTMIAIEAALAGQGVALASDELLTADLSAGRLVRLSPVEIGYGTYYLVRGTRAPRRAMTAFRDWLIEASQGLREPD